jgi:hypothetical protein
MALPPSLNDLGEGSAVKQSPKDHLLFVERPSPALAQKEHPME